MAKGRSLMALRGKTSLSEPVVIKYWKGITVAQSLPRHFKMSWTEKKKRHAFLMSFLAPRWRKKFTKYERDGWDCLAGALGSAYLQGKKDVSRGSGNIIRSRGVVMSGYNCYLRSNFDAYYADFTFPRDVAPTGDGSPPPPEDLDARYDDEKEVVIEFPRPSVLDNATDLSIEVWCQVQSIVLGRGQLVGVIKIRDSQEPQIKEENRYRFAFSRFPCSKRTFGKYEVAFNELDGGFARVQVCTVVAYGATRGAIRGFGGVVREVKIPPNPESSLTPFLREKFNAYRRWLREKKRKILGSVDPIRNHR